MNSQFRVPKVLAIVLPAGLLLCVLFMPLGMDNSLFQSTAIDLIRFHKLPYIGSWDQNFPGIILFHSAAILLFGTSDMSYRALDVLLQIGLCIVFYRLERLWLDRETSWFGVFIYLCYYLHRGYDVEGQRDTYGILLIIVALYILFRSSEEKISYLRLIGSGALVGIAVLIKPLFLGYGIIAVMGIPALKNKRCALTFLGFGLLPLLLSYGLYACIPGGMEQYWVATVRFNLELYSTFGGKSIDLLYGLLIPLYVTVPALIAILPISQSSASSGAPAIPGRLKLVYVCFLCYALFCVLIQRKYLAYHFAPWMILLTPLGAIGSQKLISLVRPRQLAGYVAISIILVLALPKIALLRSLHRPLDTPGMFGRVAISAPDMMYDSASAVVRYLSIPENKNGRIEVCSFNARLRALLARNTVGRYPSLHGIGLRTDTANPYAFTDYQRQWRAAYMDSLRTVRPLLIILARGTNSWYLQDPYTDLLHFLPGFDSLISRSYHLDTIIGSFQIYRRNSG